MKKAIAEEKKEKEENKKAQKSGENKDEAKGKNGRRGVTFNLTATAVAGNKAACGADEEAALVAAATSLVAAVAAAEATASAAPAAKDDDNKNNTIKAEAPFLRQLVKPKHLRYDWEEVHPALALSNGLVVAAPRNGGGRKARPLPAVLRFVETKAFANTGPVVLWVSLGAAMFLAVTKAFDKLEALTFFESSAF